MKKYIQNVLLIPAWMSFLFATICMYAAYKFHLKTNISEIKFIETKHLINSVDCLNINKDAFIEFTHTSVEQWELYSQLLQGVSAAFIILGITILFLVFIQGRER